MEKRDKLARNDSKTTLHFRRESELVSSIYLKTRSKRDYIFSLHDLAFVSFWGLETITNPADQAGLALVLVSFSFFETIQSRSAGYQPDIRLIRRTSG